MIDTNVFISTILFVGISNKLVDLWQKEEFKFLLSKEILDEYIKVLHYPKFELKEFEIGEIIKKELIPYITPVKVKKIAKIIKEDPDDNKFLACAIYGKANFIISGDKHLLKIKKYKDTSIISVKKFLDIIK